MREIVIIQCAGRKNQGFWTWRGQKLVFVANKAKYLISHPSSDCVPCEPDDLVSGSDDLTWRRLLLEYYQTKCRSPVIQDADELVQAWQLYTHPIYRSLAEGRKCSRASMFILSAGWGLVNADYRLPPYNITFSRAPGTPAYARIGAAELWSKVQQLCGNPLIDVVDRNTTIHFFGGEQYRSLLYYYMDTVSGTKVVYHIGDIRPRESSQRPHGYVFTQYTPKNPELRTNWHYECARRFIEGGLNT